MKNIIKENVLFFFLISMQLALTFLSSQTLFRSRDSVHMSYSIPYKTSKIKFSILGGGAFSLALAQVLSHKNITSTMLVRTEDVANHINTYHKHPKYLPGSTLPNQLCATCDPEIALKNADYIIHAVPMQQSRAFLTKMKPYFSRNIPILSVTKGVEQGTK
jgi:glycerol-3-phosphate dehydrogenase (NAD+)